MKDLDLPDIAPPSTALPPFAEAALRVAVAAARFDGTLLFDELHIVLELAQRLLPAYWSQPATQAAVLGLFGEERPDERALADIRRIVAEERVSRRLRDLVADAVLALLNESPQCTTRHQRLGLDVLEALEVRDSERLRRAGALSSMAGEDPSSWGWVTRLLRSGSDRVQGWLASDEVSQAFAFERTATQARWLAEQLQDHALVGTIDRLTQAVRPQPLRVVFVGELKHGKSTLVNAVAGQSVSPTGESAATTRAVLELFGNEHPKYSGTWLDERRIAGLRGQLESERDNPRSQETARKLDLAVRNPAFEAGGEFPDVATLDELADYLVGKGIFADAVDCVRVGLPVPVLLESGAVLVDTPGINDSMRIREALTHQEARRADVIVFVMTASKMESESERRFLRALLQEGRAVDLVPVVTHTDQLSGDAGRADAMKRAAAFVDLCMPPERRSIRVHPAVGLDARKAAEQSLRNSGSLAPEGTDLRTLQDALARVVGEPDRAVRAAKRIAEARQELSESVRAATQAWQQRYQSVLPSEDVVAAQADLTLALERSVDAHEETVLRQLSGVRDDLVELSSSFRSELRHELGILGSELQALVGEHALKLGKQFHDAESWRAWEREVADPLLKERMEAFEHRWRQRFNGLDRRLAQYRAEAAEQRESLRDQFVARVESIEGRAATTSRSLGIFLGARGFVDSIDSKVAAALGGAGIGAAAAGAPLLAIGGQLLPVLMTPAGAVGVAVATAGYLALKAINIDKARASFVESTAARTREWLTEKTAPVPDHFDQLLEAYWALFCTDALRYYGPVFAESRAVVARSRLLHDLWRRCRGDGERFVAGILDAGGNPA